MSNIKRIDINEFQSEGYLQEVNRQFFHPLGLALEIVRDDDGSARLGGVWDYRDDPEGMFFDVEDLDTDDARQKAANVEAQRQRLAAERHRVAGSAVQEFGQSFLDESA